MRILRLALPFAILCSAMLCRADEFAAVKCGEDIPKAMIGKTVSNSPIEAIAKAHPELNLKMLGADGTEEDPFGMTWWEICKSNYLLLIAGKKHHSLIADALMIPDALKDLPQSLPGSSCQQDGKPVEGELFAILDKESHAGISQVRQAWRIDLTAMKFVSVPVAGLTCKPE